MSNCHLIAFLSSVSPSILFILHPLSPLLQAVRHLGLVARLGLVRRAPSPRPRNTRHEATGCPVSFESRFCWNCRCSILNHSWIDTHAHDSFLTHFDDCSSRLDVNRSKGEQREHVLPRWTHFSSWGKFQRDFFLTMNHIYLGISALLRKYCLPRLLCPSVTSGSSVS